MKSKRNTLLVGLVALEGLLLFGCGGGDSSMTATSNTQTAAQTATTNGANVPAPPTMNSPYPPTP